MSIKVYNRSVGEVVYALPEMNINRIFAIGETKNLEESELEALSQSYGGLRILQHDLLVEDKAWVAAHFDAPIEYWWKPDKIKDAMLNDSIELFTETLDYAPEGVIEYIKMYAYKLPLTDLNKIEALRAKTDFDAMAAAEFMKEDTAPKATAPTRTRLRREED